MKTICSSRGRWRAQKERPKVTKTYTSQDIYAALDHSIFYCLRASEIMFVPLQTGTMCNKVIIIRRWACPGLNHNIVSWSYL